MKFLLALLTVALLAQMSFAASIQRYKRNADPKKTSFQIMTELIAYEMPKLAAISKQLPDTPAYSKSKADIDEIVKYYETRNDNILCLEKALNLMKLIQNFINQAKEDQSEVGKKVLELIERQKDEAKAKQVMAEMKDAAEPTMDEALSTC